MAEEVGALSCDARQGETWHRQRLLGWGVGSDALYKTKITRWEIGSTRRVDCANPDCSPDTTQQDNKLLDVDS